MKNFGITTIPPSFFVILLLLSAPVLSLASPSGNPSTSADEYLALPIAKGEAAAGLRMLYRYGVTFIETEWHAPQSGSIQVNEARMITSLSECASFPECQSLDRNRGQEISGSVRTGWQDRDRAAALRFAAHEWADESRDFG